MHKYSLFVVNTKSFLFLNNLVNDYVLIIAKSSNCSLYPNFHYIFQINLLKIIHYLDKEKRAVHFGSNLTFLNYSDTFLLQFFSAYNLCIKKVNKQ